MVSRRGLDLGERLGAGALALWTLAFVVHRGAVLCGGFNGIFYWEETYRLLVAEALVGGWKLPLLDLQADTYAGGSLVVAFLASPIVALTGPSVLGLKIVALLWSAAGLVAWVVLVDRYWGRRAAHYFALGFVFAPPLFVIYNLIAMGSHAEVATLAGLQLLLAYRVLYDGDRSTRAVAMWGVVAGLGTWFTYIAGIPFTVCVAIGLVGGTLPARRWPALAGGLLCGMTPWIVTNIASGGRGLDVVATTFGSASSDGGRSLADYVATLGNLVHTGIPLALQFHDVATTFGGVALQVPRRVFASGYLALYAGSWIALLVSSAIAASARSARPWGRLRAIAATRPEVPLLVLFPFFTAILAGSNQIFLFQHELVPFLSFRMLVPVLPAVIWAPAVVASRLRAPWRPLLVAALALIGVAGTAQILAIGSSARPRIEAEARVLGAQAMGHLLFYKHGTDIPLIVTRIAAMPEELRAPAYEGIGFSIAYHYPATRPPADLPATIMQIPAPYRADAVRGVRVALGPGMEQVKALPPSARTRAMLDAVDTLDLTNRDS